MMKVQDVKIFLEIRDERINKIRSRWIPAAESNGILFAPNEGYGLLTLAHTAITPVSTFGTDFVQSDRSGFLYQEPTGILCLVL